MPSLLENYDLAQVVLYLFWIFFAGLIFYLQREAQREGYPVEVDGQPGRFRAKSLIFYPPPKTFQMPHGGVRTAPSGQADTRVIAGAPVSRLGGSPLEPTGANPMLDSIGPGSWAERSDTPDLTVDGRNKIVPLRVAGSYALSAHDPDPRGLDVVGCDKAVGGKVVDVWVDRSECLIRYIEVAVPHGKTTRNVLLPMTFAVIKSKPGRVIVEAVTGAQLAHVPATVKADSVTLLEEDKICAYYGPSGAADMSHDDYAAEPDPAAPGQLPEGETILWQGLPEWRDLAWRVYHLREAAAYFALLMAWRGFSAWWETGLLSQVALAMSPLLIPAGLSAAIIALIAWLSARTTRYTITSKRLVLKVGMALPTTFNLPFSAIGAANVRMAGGGCGDISVTLSSGDKLAYLMLWPHVRPWRLKKPEPMMRALPECAKVADILAAGLRGAAGQSAATMRPVTATGAKGKQHAVGTRHGEMGNLTMASR
eukprot:gene17463-23016_t